MDQNDLLWKLYKSERAFIQRKRPVMAALRDG